jgi:hypothetical protein
MRSVEQIIKSGSAFYGPTANLMGRIGMLQPGTAYAMVKQPKLYWRQMAQQIKESGIGVPLRAGVATYPGQPAFVIRRFLAHEVAETRAAKRHVHLGGRRTRDMQVLWKAPPATNPASAELATLQTTTSSAHKVGVAAEYAAARVEGSPRGWYRWIAKKGREPTAWEDAILAREERNPFRPLRSLEAAERRIASTASVAGTSVFAGPPSGLITGFLRKLGIRRGAPQATGRAAMGPTETGIKVTSRIDVQDVRGDHGLPVDLSKADRAVDRYLSTGGHTFGDDIVDATFIKD